jgi:D-proline reductase (dithiol) PrdB
MSVAYIPRTRELYAGYAPYRWVINEDVPWTPLAKPLRECKVALISSGGVHHKDQVPFHFRDDVSYYKIPRDVDIEDLCISHFGYRTDDARQDPNCVFPLERMRELAAEGVMGEFADPAYTFAGGIYSARKVRDELAPGLVEELTANRVDLFYLVPA